MKIVYPTLGALAISACLFSSNAYADRIVMSTSETSLPAADAQLYSPLGGADTGDFTQAETRYQSELTAAISAETAPKPHKIVDNTQMEYRLNILGDMFTPGEKAFLSSSSKVYGAAREMVRESAAVRLDHSERGANGSAYSRGISTALLTAADQTGNVWAPLTSWMVPSGGLRANLSNQIAPMVWDVSEKSRGSSFGGATFLEKAVVFLPNGGSIANQLEMAEFKVAIQSVVSGKWPTFAHASDIDYARFCKVWARRLANVAMANYISTLLTPNSAGRPGSKEAAKLHGPPPITVNYRY